MRGLGFVLCVIVALVPPPTWAETRVQVSITSPADGAVIRGTPRTRVEGHAQALRDYAPQQYDVLFIIDTSGSTGAPSGAYVRGKGDSILAAEVEAAERLLDRLDPRTARVGVVTFEGPYNRLTGFAIPGAQSAFLEQPLTSNYDLVRAAFQKVLRKGPGGGTDMAAGIRLAVRELAGLQGSVSLPDPRRRKVGLLLTDGFPTLPFGRVNSMDPGDVETAVSAAQVAARGGITIHTFALGLEALSAPFACTEIARVTQGVFTPLPNPSQVIDILPKTSFADVDLVSVSNRTTGELASDLVVHPDGRFHAQVPLTRGANQIKVDVLTTDGSRGSAEISIHYVAEESLDLEIVRENQELELKLQKLKEQTKALELKLRKEEEAKAQEERRRQLELEIKRAQEEP